MKKRIIWKTLKITLPALTILFLTALIFSTGCKKGNKEEGKVVIRFTTWESAGEGMDVLQKIINQFERKYPNIKVKVEQVPGGDYSGKILTQIAGGQAPDVINTGLHTGDLPIYAEKGVLLSLEDFARTDPDFKKNDYFASCIKACSYKNKLYVVSKDGNPYILYYNKTLFKQAGLPYPDENWTWDDLLTASRKLTKFDKNGRAIVLGGGYDLGHYYTLLVQNGGSAFDKDVKKSLLDSPQSVSTLEYVLQFYNENLIPAQGTEQESFSGINSLDLFPTGKIAMWIFHPYRIGDCVKRIKNFEWDVAPIPLPKGGRRFSELIHVGYAISATTKHPKECWEFIKWLGGPVGQEMMANLKYGVPALKSVAYSNKYGPPPEHIRVAAEAMEYSELFPAFDGSREIRDMVINPILEKIMLGRLSVTNGLKEMARKTDEFLKEGYLKNQPSSGTKGREAIKQ